MTQLNLFDRKAIDRSRDARKTKWAKEQRVAKAHLATMKQILSEKKQRDFKLLLITSLEEGRQ